MSTTKFDDAASTAGLRVIRRYPNRRLYDTQRSAYISLADVKAMVLAFERVVIQDSKTGADVTRSMLLQVLLESESGGVPLFSDVALANLIRIYGMAPGAGAQAWFETQLNQLMQMQERMKNGLGGLGGLGGVGSLGGLPTSAAAAADWLKPWMATPQSWISAWHPAPKPSVAPVQNPETPKPRTRSARNSKKP
jgi:polyhydroxyalkanoate synthesis repressor PhaR